VAESLSDKLVTIVQKIFWPFVGVSILAIIVSFVYSYKKGEDFKKLERAQDELFVLRKDVEKIATSLEPADDPKKDSKAPIKEKLKPSAEVLEKSYADVAQKLMGFIKTNQGTQPAVEAALLVSEMTKDYNKEMGIEGLNAALKDFPASLFLFGVGQTELGNLYSQNNKCLEAAQAWEKVIAEKNHSYLAASLRLKAGVCYEKQNQLDKAEKLYQEIVDKEPNSFSGRTAKKFLMHLKLMKSKATANSGSLDQKNG
jgi:tetratricopeptide (TPR) repeat protein